ncbi:granulin b isoform X2 [Pseudoliparis swirei]|uniref:granulin b isoform X2 n=1 Tax=Pseudoliparis swirei TaxID=2059687 RepID=UPI0024BECBDE|nr:granulin b isoform X2 [Pseudoliparis swirei]
MWILVPALLVLGSALVCPDGDECESNNTCCKDAAGQYGCCPLPRAECCTDLLHCCYEGTLCDLVHGRCVNKTVSLPWRRRLPPRPAAPRQLRAVVCPDRESECPDGTTCCQLAGGSWGCCLFPKAVCCEDKRHCCPERTTCDLQHARCQAGRRGSFPMLEKRPARRTGNHSAPLVGSVVPPVGSVVPPVGSVVPPVGSVVPPVGSVTCPGGQSSCPDGYTCCLKRGGAYSCCPYAQAVCCSDQLHCCPPDTECDLEHGACKAGATASTTAPLRRLAAASRDVECPDASACPAQTTCCKTTSGVYGCCPMRNAVCCSDHLHCCPEGTDCDVAHSACINARGETAMSAIAVTTLEEVQSNGAVVPCNGSVVCAAGSTCCSLPQVAPPGRPDVVVVVVVTRRLLPPQAVCCEDHLHCCPHATVCNLEASTCDDAAAGTATPWHAKGPASLWNAISPASPAPDAKCDESASCPERSTCCRTQGGGWACCPMPQAVCCSDLLHCCPRATVCNLPTETCDDPAGVSPPARWLEKTPAVTSERAPAPLQGSGPARPTRTACDEQTSCPRDATCCFMGAARRWGCCPVPEAVCCGDGLHCCPEGHACEPHRSACSRGAGVPWLSKLSAVATPGAVSDVKCDGRSSCTAGTTCCKLLTGEWGCCPLVQAVCCADREHCCPQGYTCNMETSTCEKASPQTTVVRPDGAAEEEDAGTVPCDAAGEFRCSERDTCCRVSASEWACCPSPQAVCCPDSRHCCPARHSCDPRAAGCSPLTWGAPLGVRRRL